MVVSFLTGDKYPAMRWGAEIKDFNNGLQFRGLVSCVYVAL